MRPAMIQSTSRRFYNIINIFSSSSSRCLFIDKPIRKFSNQQFLPCTYYQYASVRTNWNHPSNNKYSRFRQRVACQSRPKHHEEIDSTNNNVNNARSLAEDAFTVLARKNRTWKRLRHLVDLVCDNLDDWNSSSSASEDHRIKTIADVGCDHGLLAIGMAITGYFDKVVGVDVSERALQDGAISFHNEVLDILKRDDDLFSSVQKEYFLPIEFRLGDGLQVLHPGEADAICIAGMGVNTMLKIIFQESLYLDTSSDVEKNVLEIDRIGCQQLLLQPTNSKPRNLVLLYDQLQKMGWYAKEEKIEYIAPRWYISVLFVRSTDGKEKVLAETVLPGQLLADTTKMTVMHNTYKDYVLHHQRWLQEDLNKKHKLHEDEIRWLDANKHIITA